MSSQSPAGGGAGQKVKRLMAPDIAAMKGGAPIVSLTSYHAHTAAIADPYCDFLLVGDSLGMVMHGFETTVPVPLELMIMHGRAVVRGAKRALVVVDMPFGTYEESPSMAFRNAARVMKETDCGAIKLEGGRRMAETIRYLVDRGIPVMAHIGLTPQSINVIGGFKAQGREEAHWAAIEEDARQVAEAGAFSVVLGLSPRVPKFVKEFGAVGAAIEGAIRSYAAEVRARSFPSTEHTYGMSDPQKSDGAANSGRATKKPKNTSS